MTAQTMQNRQTVQWGSYSLNALITLVVAAVANAIVYFIAAALGAIPETVLVGPMSQPITLLPVVSATIMGGVAGVLVYAGLLRFTEQPKRIFTIMAVVVLVLAIGPTLTLGAPAAMVVALNIMHVVAGGVIVALLTRKDYATGS
jgi:hypothetical protein